MEGDSISPIILGLIIPVMVGRICLREILRVNPNAKGIIASGNSGGAPANSLISFGGKGFADKP